MTIRIDNRKFPNNKMKEILLLIVISASLLNAEMYTTKYDNMNIDEILNSDRLLKNYFNCVMERGPCTPDGTELRRYLPEALVTDCAKCSDKQKENSKTILVFLYKNKPEYFKEIQEKYDPDNIYYSSHTEMFS